MYAETLDTANASTTKIGTAPPLSDHHPHPTSNLVYIAYLHLLILLELSERASSIIDHRYNHYLRMEYRRMEVGGLGRLEVDYHLMRRLNLFMGWY